MFFYNHSFAKVLATLFGYLSCLVFAIAIFLLYISFTDAGFESSSGIIWAAIAAVIGYMLWGYSRHIADTY